MFAKRVGSPAAAWVLNNTNVWGPSVFRNVGPPGESRRQKLFLLTGT